MISFALPRLQNLKKKSRQISEHMKVRVRKGN